MLVNNKREHITYVNSTFILPGINSFNEVVSKALLDEPAFMEKVKLGVLAIIDQDGEENTEIKKAPKLLPSGVKSVSKIDILKMSNTAAIKVINEMGSVAELRELQKKEIRKTVKAAIRQRLKNIDDTAVKEEKEQSSDAVYED